MTVEEVLDLVEHREIVGRIGSVRVHVAAHGPGEPPQPGDCLPVHAGRWCELA
jgi:hypothetical protein